MSAAGPIRSYETRYRPTGEGGGRKAEGGEVEINIAVAYRVRHRLYNYIASGPSDATACRAASSLTGSRCYRAMYNGATDGDPDIERRAGKKVGRVGWGGGRGVRGHESIARRELKTLARPADFSRTRSRDEHDDIPVVGAYALSSSSISLKAL